MTDQEISDYLFIEDQDQKGDIALVFGIRDWDNPLEKAIDLYLSKMVSKIIFTGGINRNSGEHEARNMYKEAIKRGIDEKDLLLEDEASNTLENVIFSRKILEDKNLFKNINIICAVMANIHARRALMTLKKNMPSNIIIKSCPYIYKRFGVTKENWMNTETGNRVVKKELDKINIYLKKGDIAEI